MDVIGMQEVCIMIRFICALVLFIVHTTLYGTDTIPVYEEPHHHLIFNNDDIRILDVRLQPGDTSAWHVHSHAITYIGLEGSRIWLDVPGEHPRSVYLPDDFWGGDTEYPETNFVHRIANVGFQPFRLMAIEHLQPRRDIQFATDDLEDWESMDVNPYFLLFRLILEPGQSRKTVLDGPGLLISRGKGEVIVQQQAETLSMGLGSWLSWPQRQEAFTLTNQSRDQVEIIYMLH